MAVTVRKGIEGKECSDCHEWKPLTEYYTDPTHGLSQGGRHCVCRACHSRKGKERRAVIQRAKREGLIQN